MKSAQKGFSPIIIVIILAVVGIGGFLLYSSKNSQQTSIIPSKTTDTPTSSLTSETTNWSAYFNPDAHIRMRYPSDWIKTTGYPHNSVIVGFIKDKLWEVNITYTIPSVGAKSDEELFSIVRNDSEKDYRNLPDSNISVNEPIDFSGLKGRKFVMTFTLEKKMKAESFFGVKNGSAFAVSYRAPLEKFDEMLPTAEKMLHTFEVY